MSLETDILSRRNLGFEKFQVITNGRRSRGYGLDESGTYDALVYFTQEVNTVFTELTANSPLDPQLYESAHDMIENFDLSIMQEAEKRTSNTDPDQKQKGGILLAYSLLNQIVRRAHGQEQYSREEKQRFATELTAMITLYQITRDTPGITYSDIQYFDPFFNVFEPDSNIQPLAIENTADELWDSLTNFVQSNLRHPTLDEIADMIPQNDERENTIRLLFNLLHGFDYFEIKTDAQLRTPKSYRDGVFFNASYMAPEKSGGPHIMERLTDTFDVSQLTHLVDMGTGTGALPCFFARELAGKVSPSCKISGVDIQSQTYFKNKIQKEFEGAPLKPEIIDETDIFDYLRQLPDHSVDIFTGYSTHFMFDSSTRLYCRKNIQLLREQLLRVMKPNGIIDGDFTKNVFRKNDPQFTDSYGFWSIRTNVGV